MPMSEWKSWNIPARSIVNPPEQLSRRIPSGYSGPNFDYSVESHAVEAIRSLEDHLARYFHRNAGKILLDHLQ